VTSVALFDLATRFAGDLPVDLVVDFVVLPRFVVDRVRDVAFFTAIEILSRRLGTL